MTKFHVDYDASRKRGAEYEVYFNPSPANFGVEESSMQKGTFMGCLDFFMGRLTEKATLLPHMAPFALTVEGELPGDERKILESIVSLYNRGPEMYDMLSRPGDYQSIGEYFGHVEPAGE